MPITDGTSPCLIRTGTANTLENRATTYPVTFPRKQLQTLFHAYAVTHRLKKAVRNDTKYGIPLSGRVSECVAANYLELGPKASVGSVCK